MEVWLSLVRNSTRIGLWSCGLHPSAKLHTKNMLRMDLLNFFRLGLPSPAPRGNVSSQPLLYVGCTYNAWARVPRI
jgi:hypothetical protein